MTELIWHKVHVAQRVWGEGVRERVKSQIRTAIFQWYQKELASDSD